MIDFRLCFRWPGSLGFWGIMSSAAERAHCTTTLNSTHLLDKGKQMMAHVKVVEGRSMEIGYTHADSAGRTNQNVQRGRDFPTHVSQPCTRRRLSPNPGTAFRRRQDCLNCIGLPRLGSRALIGTGGGRGVAHFSPEEEYELGLHDWCVRVHYQFADDENLVSARKGQKYKKVAP